MEACFKARSHQEGARQGGPNPQEFVSKAIQELQESRVMRGSRLLPAVAPIQARMVGCASASTYRGSTSRVSGVPLALASGTLRGSAPQLRSHALWLAERGCRVPAPHEGHPGGSRGQAFRSPGGDGDGPRGATSASGASRGPWAWGLVRIGSRSPSSLLHQHPFVPNIIR